MEKGIRRRSFLKKSAAAAAATALHFIPDYAVGKTAKALERLFFLTEQEPKYFEYMQSKSKQPNMFKERETKLKQQYSICQIFI